MKKLIAVSLLLAAAATSQAIIVTNVLAGTIFNDGTNSVSMYNGVITAG